MAEEEDLEEEVCLFLFCPFRFCIKIKYFFRNFSNEPFVEIRLDKILKLLHNLCCII